MMIKRNGWLFLLGVGILFIVVTVLAPLTSYSDPLYLAVRLCALNGFVALAIATAMTPFLKEITQAFGRSFLRIHHIFAILGLVFATLHPVFYAVLQADILVFVPQFGNWQVFWELAGRPALYILYLATIVAVLRTMLQKYWRYVHALMYLVLVFVIVHANLIGTDFQNPILLVIMNALFVLTIFTFALKRYQYYQRKQKIKARQTQKQEQ
jgi:predicted ferric reductase